MNLKQYEKKYQKVFCKRIKGQTQVYLEFMIQFNKETAYHLGGPFLGNYAYGMVQDCRIISNWKILSLDEERQRTNLPLDRPTIENPVRLYICGNDDFSWTKFLPSVKEGIKEAKLLLSIQPIDFFKDIENNGFVFTN